MFVLFLFIISIAFPKGALKFESYKIHFCSYSCSLVTFLKGTLFMSLFYSLPNILQLNKNGIT